MGDRTVKISYFSDVLCIWAYVAQIKIDEVKKQFGADVQLEYHFIPVFGNTFEKLEAAWQKRGGLAGYARHVKAIAERSPHISLGPHVWTKDIPPSSAGCHVFVKAIQRLVEKGELPAAPQERFAGRSLAEEYVWRLRLAFFCESRNIAELGLQLDIANQMQLPTSAITGQIENGGAFAALCADADLQKKYLIEGSPTFLLDQGRQKLYGNVGYRIIEANIKELMHCPDDAASWC